MDDNCTPYVLWKPEAHADSGSTHVAFPQLAEFVVVTTAEPVRDRSQLDAILASPPTLDMIETMLRCCPLTGDHFRLNVPIRGTFAVWVQSREGNHWFVVPRGYDVPERKSLVPGVPGDNPCLNLVTDLTAGILGKPIPAEAVVQCGMTTTLGDFAIFAFGVSTPRCDVCGQPVDQTNVFTLSAKQIVSTPQYWRLRYERNRGDWAAIGLSSFDEYRSNQQVRDTEVQIILQLGSDWLVCGDCIEHFDVDREEARQFAAAWWTDRTLKGPYDWAATSSDVKMR